MTQTCAYVIFTGRGSRTIAYILRPFSMQASARALDYRTFASQYGSHPNSANEKAHRMDGLFHWQG